MIFTACIYGTVKLLKAQLTFSFRLYTLGTIIVTKYILCPQSTIWTYLMECITLGKNKSILVDYQVTVFIKKIILKNTHTRPCEVTSEMPQTDRFYQKPYCPRFAEYNTTVHYDGSLIVQSPSQQPRSKET